MKIVAVLAVIACSTQLATAQFSPASAPAALAPALTGAIYTYGANIQPRSPNDDPSVGGYTRIRTDNGTLFFESLLNNATSITAVHIHLTPTRGTIDGGPLVIALTNTTSSPLSGQPLLQVGNVTDTNLAANAQIAAARQAIVALGINDNTLQNIGDVDRLLRAGVLYGDVHSTIRLSPNRTGSGLFEQLPANLGRRMLLSAE